MKKEENSNLPLAMVASVALVSVVALVALVMNSPAQDRVAPEVQSAMQLQYDMQMGEQQYSSLNEEERNTIGQASLGGQGRCAGAANTEDCLSRTNGGGSSGGLPQNQAPECNWWCKILASI